MTDQLDVDPDSLAEKIQAAGVAGAGGAGFPAYAKWTDPDAVSWLLMNHQESEPNFYSDKWLAQEHPEAFATLFDALVDPVFDAVVVGTKEKYRDDWMGPLEAATDAEIRTPDELPLEAEDESGVVLAYTGNDYNLSEEPILLVETADVMTMGDLPTDYGWVVQNTESIYNIYQALSSGTPVTRKYVVVDGDTPEHRLLDVPIGTTAEQLLVEAGVDGLGDDMMLLDGGPGWCSTIEAAPEAFGVSKRTNAVLAIPEDEAEEHRDDFEEVRVNLLEARDWNDRDHETTPTAIEPDVVRIPLMTNEAHEGLVEPGVPVVDVGDEVETGDLVAAAAEEGISIPHHASIDGTIADVTDTHVVIER